MPQRSKQMKKENSTETKELKNAVKHSLQADDLGIKTKPIEPKSDENPLKKDYNNIALLMFLYLLQVCQIAVKYCIDDCFYIIVFLKKKGFTAGSQWCTTIHIELEKSILRRPRNIQLGFLAVFIKAIVGALGRHVVCETFRFAQKLAHTRSIFDWYLNVLVIRLCPYAFGIQ